MRKVIIYKFLVVLLLSIYSCSKDSGSNDTLANSDNGQSGSLARFTILDDYLYTVDNQNLNVFNVANPENPVLVNTVAIGFNIETLFAFRTYLYIGSRNGMFIYTASNPELPQLLSSVEHFTACDPVIANASHAYVTLKGGNLCGGVQNVLEVYDVNDVENPVLITTRNLVQPVGIAFYQNYLFVCDDEVKIFDITNPEQMSLVHAIATESFDVIIQDNNLILVGEEGVYQYALDPNNIQNETYLSTISL